MSEITTKTDAKSEKTENAIVNYVGRKNGPEFAIRVSPLTELINNSLHIKAIYHIFVAILLMLLFDTVIYDLVEKGKINVGLNAIVKGFCDMGRATRLWLFEFAVVTAFYVGLRTYAVGIKLFKKHPETRQVLSILGVSGVAFLQIILIGGPIWSLSKENLALGTSAIVTCEMFRFAMKIHSVVIVCGPRCHREDLPLPSFKHYVYYLFAPTLVYRDTYPRTKKIRWSVVLFHFSEVAAIIFYNSFLAERFILPYWSDYGKNSQIEAGTVVRGMFACVLPGVISFLCGFYGILHAWLNAFAEMLRFGDRLFYEEWWTTSSFSRYYRAWNRVVHSWLHYNIYKPLVPHAGRPFSTFIVFFISAVAHEVILAFSFGFFFPVLLIEFGVFGLLFLPLTSASGRRFPEFLNLLIWLSFFLGNGILWSMYPMEYFARKNCPPTENDSFFIPKSFTCPEIVLKPNWTFQNPLRIIY
ncbi:hypothetical protein K1T71_003854 [Dendrolimus kikuchii]|uniref:Uncharacterized protein n=1 Tax=Dendrolimus kikuchii TaxID=765133 RepID=A0ACC1D9A6_9NEOP|nr:hypothetical protein K1T71_003854 [Dendrolimus kikuchii]